MPLCKTAPRIVVTDGQAMIRQLIARQIEADHGRFPVAECASLRGAEAVLRREKPELVVVDGSLPDGQGFDLVRRLRAEQPHLRWVFTSKYEQAYPIREAHKLRIHGFVMQASPFPSSANVCAASCRGKVTSARKAPPCSINSMTTMHGSRRWNAGAGAPSPGEEIPR